MVLESFAIFLCIQILHLGAIGGPETSETKGYGVRELQASTHHTTHCRKATGYSRGVGGVLHFRLRRLFHSV